MSGYVTNRINYILNFNNHMEEPLLIPNDGTSVKIPDFTSCLVRNPNTLFIGIPGTKKITCINISTGDISYHNFKDNFEKYTWTERLTAFHFSSYWENYSHRTISMVENNLIDKIIQPTISINYNQLPKIDSSYWKPLMINIDVYQGYRFYYCPYDTTYNDNAFSTGDNIPIIQFEYHPLYNYLKHVEFKNMYIDEFNSIPNVIRNFRPSKFTILNNNKHVNYIAKEWEGDTPEPPEPEPGPDFDESLISNYKMAILHGLENEYIERW